MTPVLTFEEYVLWFKELNSSSRIFGLVHPKIQLSVTELDFPVTLAGLFSDSLDVVVTNIGTGSLHFLPALEGNFVVLDPATGVDSTPYSLGSLQSIVLHVKFVPPFPGPMTGILSFITNVLDGIDPVPTITLTGLAMEQIPESVSHIGLGT